MLSCINSSLLFFFGWLVGFCLFAFFFKVFSVRDGAGM